VAVDDLGVCDTSHWVDATAGDIVGEWMVSIPLNELVIRTLGPASWRTVDLAGKDRHANRD
jgi:hypothetical protein